jgi:hypothetical protein
MVYVALGTRFTANILSLLKRLYIYHETDSIKGQVRCIQILTVQVEGLSLETWKSVTFR